MKADQLIEIAEQAGIGVSKKAAGIYEVQRVIGGKHYTENFYGTWHEFVAHVKRICKNTATVNA